MTQTLQSVNEVFDGQAYEPSSGAPLPVPAGMYLVEITDTAITDLSDNKGQAFVIKSKVIEGPQAGHIFRKQYNIWNNASAENTRISRNELSAVTHVTGIYKVPMTDAGRALIGGRYQVRVDNDGKYNEIKEVYDINGNKPNKTGSGYAPAQPAPVAVGVPAGAPAQPQQGWGAPVQAAPAPQYAPQAQPMQSAQAAPVNYGQPTQPAQQAPAQPGWAQNPAGAQPAPNWGPPA